MTELAAKLCKQLEKAETGEMHSGFGNFTPTTNERFRNGWSFQPTLRKPSDDKKMSQRVGFESASTAESEDISSADDEQLLEKEGKSADPGPADGGVSDAAPSHEARATPAGRERTERPAEPPANPPANPP